MGGPHPCQGPAVTPASPALASPAPHCLWVQGSAMGLSWLMALPCQGSDIHVLCLCPCCLNGAWVVNGSWDHPVA